MSVPCACSKPHLQFCTGMPEAFAESQSAKSIGVRSKRYGAQPLHAIRSPTNTHSRTQATALTGYRQFLFEPTLVAYLALARLNGYSQPALPYSFVNGFEQGHMLLWLTRVTTLAHG
jgi:hypothetical protein